MLSVEGLIVVHALANLSFGCDVLCEVFRLFHSQLTVEVYWIAVCCLAAGRLLACWRIRIFMCLAHVSFALVLCVTVLQRFLTLTPHKIQNYTF